MTTLSARTPRANIGCGSRYHADWHNFDVHGNGRDVHRADILRGLPLADDSMDVVYHSHLLEHLPPQAATPFLAECRRVLRPGGIVRVVVPDLEAMVRAYLETLDRVDASDASAEHDHRWMVTKLCDQLTRQSSGGEMARCLAQENIANETFIRTRIGIEYDAIRSGLRRGCRPGTSVRRRLRDLAVRAILGSRRLQALRVGEFRLSGEAHQWMYDRVSLGAAMTDAGFVEVTRVSATESGIPEWSSQSLDTDADGTALKPDSLYMEARKPGGEESTSV